MLSICHGIWSFYWHWHRVRTTFWTLFGIERNHNGPYEFLMDLEYCKYTIWILVAWILALIIGLGLKFELYEIVINCVGLTIGAILLWILLIVWSSRFCPCLYSYFTQCFDYYCWCLPHHRIDKSTKDENYLFGYV